MPLINGYQLIDMLKEGKNIGGAFNTTNLETTIGILRAVEETGIPSFIQIAPTNITISGYEYIFNMVSQYAKNMKTPIALHLDHGKTLKDIKGAIDSGFTSVMIDGSEYSFEENIQITKEAVDYCKPFGIPVEAELGSIKGKEDDMVNDMDLRTNPNEISEFVERTGCNMLAVSIGNVHGLDDQPNIDFQLLEEIYKYSPVPLVIHGGSGITKEELKQIQNYGVVKINIASDLRRRYITSIGESYKNDPTEHNLIKVLEKATDSVYETVVEKIKMMNAI